MYVSLRNSPRKAGEAGRAGKIGRNVVLLGIVSLLTDISQEMVVAVLPIYLTVELGLGPLAFGVTDGLYQGGTAFVRLLGGLLSDRRSKHKEVAAAGYGLSAVCKLGLLAAGHAWGAVNAVLVLDRVGKGIRTPPRDALISLSADEEALGRAFGVHRALDTTGALIGPLIGFLLLAARPGAYGGIFATSFGFGLVGFGVLVLFVQGRQGHAKIEEPEPVSIREAAGLLRLPDVRMITAAGGALGLFTISDAFVYLLLQRQTDMNPRWFPLLFLGTAISYLLLAIPAGQLADRIGRGRVFVLGYVPLIATYLVLVFWTHLGFPGVAVCLALLGSYYASTDGVLMALTSTRVPEHLRTSGIAIVTTATGTTRFLASIAFGALWMFWGPHDSALAFLIGLLVAIAAAVVLLRKVLR